MSPAEGFEGRTVPDPGFAGDDGSADPALAAALAGWAAGGELDAVLRALLEVRLLVPVIAVATAIDVRTGADKATDMAVITIRGDDGREALPVFTALEYLGAWNAEARPVPVAATTAALAAVVEHAGLLVVDPAGPVTCRLDGPQLRALAQGRVHIPPLADPAVAEAVQDVAATEPAVTRVRLLAAGSDDADATLAFGLREQDRPGAAAVAQRLAQALATHPVLRERLVGGLDLAFVPDW